MMITEELFYKRALELGIDQMEQVIYSIHVSQRPIVNELYILELFDKEIHITQRDIENFYNENISSFTIRPSITIQHLQIHNDQLEEILDELSKGTEFLYLIDNHSINTTTRQQRGLIRNIRQNGFIAGIGHDHILDEAIAEAQVDDVVHGPIESSSGIHFFRVIDIIPEYVRSFDEVRDDIEARLNRQAEINFHDQLIQSLREKYNVIVREHYVTEMDIFNFTEDLADIVIVEGNHSEISLTLGDYFIVLRNSVVNERGLDPNDMGLRLRILNQEIAQRLFFAAAQDTGVLERNIDGFELQQVRMAVILNAFQTFEINSRVTITEEELLDFYNNNTERYTIPANRTIRHFVSENESVARRHQRNLRRLLRRGNDVEIVAYFRNESLVRDTDGILEHIYRNGMIPQLGRDEVFNELVFTTPVGTLSDVFRNIRNQVVFFHVIEEIPARVRPLSDVEGSLRNIIGRDKANQLFTEKRESLFIEYNLVQHLDRIVNMITPMELFLLAEEAQRRLDNQSANHIFAQIVTDFPETEYAYRALFMQAFIASEEPRHRQRAIELFEELLLKFPVGDLNESAQFMLDLLKSGTPIEDILGQ